MYFSGKAHVAKSSGTKLLITGSSCSTVFVYVSDRLGVD